VIAVLAAVTVAVSQSGGGTTPRPAHASVLRSTPPVSLAASGSTPIASTPAAHRLASRLAKTLSAADATTGVMVEDLSAHRIVYERNADVARPPASVEKLYTSVAALNLLGAGTRLHTAILGTGHLGAHGVWDGNLYLRGGGDPTFGDGGWNEMYMDGQGPTAAQLVAQLLKLGIRRVSGHVFGDESLFDSDRGGPATHNKPDTPDYGGEMSALVYDHGMSEPGMPPAVFAAHELVLTMRSEGIQAGGASRSAVTPPHARQLARVSSPPISTLLRLMDVPSDDLIADLLAKQIGARFFGRGSLNAGAIEIGQNLLSRYGIRPTIHDGSGLDKADRTTPAQIVSLLSDVWGTPDGKILKAALPQIGRQGTVQGIGLGTPAVGRCVAKTGTLNNVTNLAGYCTAKNGHTLAFALLLDGPSNLQAVASLSRAVGAIASY